MTRHTYTEHEAIHTLMIRQLPPEERAARMERYRMIAERTDAHWAWMLFWGYGFVCAIFDRDETINISQKD